MSILAAVMNSHCQPSATKPSLEVAADSAEEAVASVVAAAETDLIAAALALNVNQNLMIPILVERHLVENNHNP